MTGAFGIMMQFFLEHSDSLINSAVLHRERARNGSGDDVKKGSKTLELLNLHHHGSSGNGGAAKPLLEPCSTVYTK